MAIRCRSEALALGLMLVLAACKPAAERAGGADVPLPPVGAAKMALEQAACEKRGGQWVAEGGAKFCLSRTRDAGKACRTGADCQGDCLARSQTCAPVMPLVGCNEIVTSAGLRVTECVQ